MILDLMEIDGSFKRYTKPIFQNPKMMVISWTTYITSACAAMMMILYLFMNNDLDESFTRSWIHPRAIGNQGQVVVWNAGILVVAHAPVISKGLYIPQGRWCLTSRITNDDHPFEQRQPKPRPQSCRLECQDFFSPWPKSYPAMYSILLALAGAYVLAQVKLGLVLWIPHISEVVSKTHGHYRWNCQVLEEQQRQERLSRRTSSTTSGREEWGTYRLLQYCGETHDHMHLLPRQLPLDIAAVLILEFLSWQDLLTCAQVCSRWHVLSSRCQWLWQQHLVRDFPTVLFPLLEKQKPLKLKQQYLDERRLVESKRQVEAYEQRWAAREHDFKWWSRHLNLETLSTYIVSMSVVTIVWHYLDLVSLFVQWSVICLGLSSLVCWWISRHCVSSHTRGQDNGRRMVLLGLIIIIVLLSLLCGYYCRSYDDDDYLLQEPQPQGQGQTLPVLILALDFVLDTLVWTSRCCSWGYAGCCLLLIDVDDNGDVGSLTTSRSLTMMLWRPTLVLLLLETLLYGAGFPNTWLWYFVTGTGPMLVYSLRLALALYACGQLCLYVVGWRLVPPIICMHPQTKELLMTRERAQLLITWRRFLAVEICVTCTRHALSFVSMRIWWSLGTLSSLCQVLVDSIWALLVYLHWSRSISCLVGLDLVHHHHYHWWSTKSSGIFSSLVLMYDVYVDWWMDDDGFSMSQLTLGTIWLVVYVLGDFPGLPRSCMSRVDKVRF